MTAKSIMPIQSSSHYQHLILLRSYLLLPNALFDESRAEHNKERERDAVAAAVFVHPCARGQAGGQKPTTRAPPGRTTGAMPGNGEITPASRWRTVASNRSRGTMVRPPPTYYVHYHDTLGSRTTRRQAGRHRAQKNPRTARKRKREVADGDSRRKGTRDGVSLESSFEEEEGEGEREQDAIVFYKERGREMGGGAADMECLEKSAWLPDSV
ncbi:hypothetical protein MUK42_17081 [Musa troglodytarum]|uniref:Uncharacterized protein n=1 Tax=Musa troglodytarum TaxID=320322 RepID=A0A9E7L3D4_9LILI|nr:hypothetical protein MUK42_17081 [Musa troglodytarum]